MSKQEMDWSFSPGGRKRLRHFITSNRRRATAARHLDMEWPQAVNIRDRLNSLITDGFHINDRPVLHQIMDKALVAYAQTLRAGLNDRDRLAAFLRVVEIETNNALHAVRLNDDTGAHWALAGGGLLEDWLIQHTPCAVEIDAEAKEDERERVQAVIREHLGIFLPGNWNW
jgi:hypothetical protein